MHVQKYNFKGVHNVLAHYENYFARAKRENVDNKLFCKNYNLLSTNERGFARLKKILVCDKIKKLNRKDVNVMCDVVVSAPENLPKNRQDEFFEFAFEFLRRRYNCPVLSAWVHKDEPRAKPHLHFAFAPIVQKNGQFKFCAKEIVNRQDLKTLHTDFKKFIDKKMNLDLDILNGATENGNKTINELKAESIMQDIRKLQKLKNHLQQEIQREISR